VICGGLIDGGEQLVGGGDKMRCPFIGSWVGVFGSSVSRDGGCVVRLDTAVVVSGCVSVAGGASSDW
jgi:hypothetical protein